jgi:hypothetical protein
VLRDAVTRIRGLPCPTDHLDDTLISLPIKMGGLGVLSYKTVAPHAYAAASEAADFTLAPVLTPEALPANNQITTQHQRCQEIFAGNKEALLGLLTNPAAGPGRHRGILQAEQGLAHHDTIPVLSAPRRLRGRLRPAAAHPGW